jgi:Flp pilus assembly protein TadG
VEFTFGVIILLMLLLGVTELGRGFWYYSAIQKTARDYARCASQIDWVDPNATTRLATCQANGVASANEAGLVPVLEAGDMTLDCDGGGCAWGSGTAPEYVTVSVAYTMPWVFNHGGSSPISPLGDGSTGITFSITATMPYAPR